MRYPYHDGLNERADARGKAKAIEVYLRNYGKEFIENPDRYGIDLIRLEDEWIVEGIEVEVSVRSWKNDEPFPFEYLHIQDRKLRYADLEYPAHFIKFNNPMTRAIVFSPLQDITMYPVRVVKNTELPDRENETFVHIPAECCYELVNL